MQHQPLIPKNYIILTLSPASIQALLHNQHYNNNNFIYTAQQEKLQINDRQQYNSHSNTIIKQLKQSNNKGRVRNSGESYPEKISF